MSAPLSPVVAASLARMRYEKLTDFEGATTYGQGSYGRACRICCRDDYNGELVHEPWCAAIRGEIIAHATVELEASR